MPCWRSRWSSSRCWPWSRSAPRTSTVVAGHRRSASRRSSRAPCARRCWPSASSTMSRPRSCAARARCYIMFVEILPNVLPPILVETTVRLGYAIFTVATLSFIGFGIQPPSPDWGLQHLRQLRPDRRRLLVDGAVRRRWPSPRWSSASTSSPTASQAGARMTERPDALAFDTTSTSPIASRGRDRGRCCAASAFAIGRGEAYGLVGESGCGKSTAALAAVRYLPRNGAVTGGRDLGRRPGPDGAGREALRRLRGRRRVDGLSGSRPGAQPVDPHRPPDRRGLRAARRRAAARRWTGPIAMLRPGAHRRSRAA